MSRRHRILLEAQKSSSFDCLSRRSDLSRQAVHVCLTCVGEPVLRLARSVARYSPACFSRKTAVAS